MDSTATPLGVAELLLETLGSFSTLELLAVRRVCRTWKDSTERVFKKRHGGSSSSRVLFNAFYLQKILLHLPLTKIIRAQGVCRTWNETIEESTNIQKAIFLKPYSDLVVELQPPSGGNRGEWIPEDGGQLRLPPLLNPFLNTEIVGHESHGCASFDVFAIGISSHEKNWKDQINSEMVDCIVGQKTEYTRISLHSMLPMYPPTRSYEGYHSDGSARYPATSIPASDGDLVSIGDMAYEFLRFFYACEGEDSDDEEALYLQDVDRWCYDGDWDIDVMTTEPDEVTGWEMLAELEKRSDALITPF